MNGRALVILSVLLALLAGPLAAAEEESELNAEYFWDQFVKLFNTSLVIIVLFFLLRKPVKRFFQDRGKQIDDNIRAAQAARDEAKNRMEEVKRQVSELEGELAEIKAKAIEAGESEKARIISAAEQEAGRIIKGAQREIENRIKAARQELKAYTADLAVERARESLKEKLGADEDRRLIERYIDEIKGVGMQ